MASEASELPAGVSQLRSATLSHRPERRMVAAPRVIASNVDLVTFRTRLIDALVDRILEQPLTPPITLVRQIADQLAKATGQPLDEAQDVIEAELRKRPELAERFRRG